MDFEPESPSVVESGRTPGDQASDASAAAVRGQTYEEGAITRRVPDPATATGLLSPKQAQTAYEDTRKLG